MNENKCVRKQISNRLNDLANFSYIYLLPNEDSNNFPRFLTKCPTSPELDLVFLVRREPELF